MKTNRPAIPTSSEEEPTATPPRASQLVRDPRDHRELLTDALGIRIDGSVADVDPSYATPDSDLNLLSRRKREKAWEEFQDPVNRLTEEALIYPMDPLPDTSSRDFPQYEPKLPDRPTLHDTETALQTLLARLAETMPEDVAIPEPELRLDREPPLPGLPEPDFSNE